MQHTACKPYSQSQLFDSNSATLQSPAFYTDFTTQISRPQHFYATLQTPAFYTHFYDTFTDFYSQFLRVPISPAFLQQITSKSAIQPLKCRLLPAVFEGAKHFTRILPQNKSATVPLTPLRPPNPEGPDKENPGQRPLPGTYTNQETIPVCC